MNLKEKQTTSQYVLNRRLDPSLMDEKDIERLIKADAKRARKAFNEGE